MPIHFAAARTAARSPLARALAKKAPGRAANDNGNRMGEACIDRLTKAALEHFARHGLAAADEARREAVRARLDGDDAAYDHWLGICRRFDRRLAARIERRFGADAMIS